MTAGPDTTRQESTGVTAWEKPALIIGIIGVAASAIGWFIDPVTFYRSYLPSYLFWFQIVAGSLGILMLQYMTGGEWGILIRRPLGAAARTMIWMAVLFIPIAIGIPHIYSWANPEIVAHDPVLQLKHAYLNPTAFLIRAAVYFALWILFAWRIRVLSLRFYEDRSPYTDLSRRRWAGAGLPMFCLTMTFAGIDWMMSLEPRFNSSMYGINFLIAAGLAAYAFVIIFFARLSTTKAMADILKPTHLRDLGNLMLAFVMLWAYTAFSEFLLIWYANLKEEIPHFIIRQHGAWGFIGILLIIFHFFLPFFMLLIRDIKDRASTIAVVATIILVIRYVGVYWLAAPSWYGENFHYSWMSLAALAGIGGLWMYSFINQLKGQTIIPIHETWVEEAMRDGVLKTDHA